MKSLISSIRRIFVACSLFASIAVVCPAFAAHPNVTKPADCTLYPGSVSGGNTARWPAVPTGSTTGYVYYCGTATSLTAGWVYNILAQNTSANFKTTVMPANGGPFFVYNKFSEFHADFPLDNDATSGDWGGTYYDNNFVPQLSVVYENNGTYTLNQGQVGESTAHELGHWVDNLDATLLGSSYHQAANSALFQHNLAVDWQNYNALASCGSSSLFSGQQDPTKPGTYLCNGTNGNGTSLNAAYSGGNQAIAEKLYPGIFENAANPNGELFAEGLAVYLGEYYSNGSINDAGYFMNGKSVANIAFSCTKHISESLFFLGAAPSSTSLSSWPANTGYTPCVLN